MPNIHDPDFDEDRGDLEGFGARRARLGHQLRSERVGLSLWEVDPGQVAYPYHYHFSDEELLIVLEGRPALRTPAGWRRLETGDVVRFETGEAGAHQLANDTGELVRFLATSSHGTPDIVIYPDEGKLCAAQRTPDGSGLKTYFRLADEVDYLDGLRVPEIGDVDPA